MCNNRTLHYINRGNTLSNIPRSAEDLRNLLSSESVYYGFDGNYEHGFFTPFSKREECSGYLSTDGLTSLRVCDDVYRNVLAVVLRPIVNIAIAIGRLVAAVQCFSLGVCHLLLSVFVSSQKNLEQSKEFFSLTRLHIGNVVIHAVNTPFSSLDAMIRLVTHSLASLPSFGGESEHAYPESVCSNKII